MSPPGIVTIWLKFILELRISGNPGLEGTNMAIKGFIDLHTHVLPCIDDGSHSLKETMALLKAEQQQGAAQVVATPHFYAQEMGVSEFLRKRKEAFHSVCRELSGDPALPALRCGAEVYYFPGMGRAGQLPSLVIEGTRVLLLELPFTQWTDQIAEDVAQIVREQKLTVLLAHLERYVLFQKNRHPMEDILRLPVFVQVNGGCLLDWKRRRLFKRILETGKPVVLGSDCHNMRVRLPNLLEARELITKKFSPALLDQMDQNAEILLGTGGK